MKDIEGIVLSNLLKSDVMREKYLPGTAEDDFGSRAHKTIYRTLVRLTQSTGHITKEMVQEALIGEDLVLQMQTNFLFDYGEELTPEIFGEFKKLGQKNRLVAIKDILGKELAKGVDPVLITNKLRAMMSEVEAADAMVEVSTPEQSVEAAHFVLDKWAAGDMPVVSGLPELDENLFLSQFIGYWVIAASRGVGKALAIGTEIPTPTGWTTMGDLKVGDRVFDETGAICNVTAATEVMVGRPCYRVTFSDGTVLIADEQHQWLTESKKARISRHNAKKYGRDEPRPLKRYGSDQTHKRTFAEVVTTKQIADTLKVWNGRTYETNHAVLTASPIQLPYANLPLSPYVLGAWLGDGSTDGSRFTCAEPELLQQINLEGVETVRQSQKYSYNLKGLNPILRQIGVLGLKHVPMSYRRSSVPQRLALLQGLMDTDGYCGKNGRCELTLTDQCLSETAFDLICSLGIKATIKKSDAKLNGLVTGPRWRIDFITNLPVFRLKRKLERQTAGANGVTYRRYILRAEPIESEPVKCIQVDSPNHLFLAGRTYVPTHNSALMLNIARANALRGVPSTLCSLEMSRELLYIRMAMSDPRAAGIKLTQRTIKDEQKMSDLKYAIDQLKKLPIYIVQGVSNVFRLDKISRRNAIDKGCKLTLFDYIQLGRTNPTDADVVRVSTVSRTLFGLTQPDLPNGYHGQAVIALSQYNGEGAKMNSQFAVETNKPTQNRGMRRAGNDDLAWSSQISNDADGILHLYYKGRYQNKKDIEIFCGKQRNGEEGWGVEAQLNTTEMQYETVLSRKYRMLG